MFINFSIYLLQDILHANIFLTNNNNLYWYQFTIFIVEKTKSVGRKLSDLFYNLRRKITKNDSIEMGLEQNKMNDDSLMRKKENNYLINIIKQNYFLLNIHRKSKGSKNEVKIIIIKLMCAYVHIDKLKIKF